MWYRAIQVPLNNHIYHLPCYGTGEALYDPSSTREFNLHYVCTDHARATLFTDTIAIPIGTKDDFSRESTEPPALEEKSTTVKSNAQRQLVEFSCWKGLHLDIALHDDEIDILVTPLDDLVLEDGKRVLWMSVSSKEFIGRFQTIQVEIDEATGRVPVPDQSLHWGLRVASFHPGGLDSRVLVAPKSRLQSTQIYSDLSVYLLLCQLKIQSHCSLCYDD